MTKKSFKYGIIGSGSWATAIIKILSENLEEINWYVRNKNNVDYIYKNHHNPNYLSSVELDIKKINATNDINTICNNSDVLIIAVPSEFTKKVPNYSSPDDVNPAFHEGACLARGSVLHGMLRLRRLN